MKVFFESESGKAVGGLMLTVILIAFPASAGWIAASFTLAFTVAKLRNAFERLEAEEEAIFIEEIDDTETEAAGRRAIGHVGRLPAAR
jgi:uncharacterized protein (DUF697 family)